MSNKRTRKQSRPPPWKRARKMSLPWLALSSEHEVTITDTEDGPYRFNLYLKKDDERLQEITTRLHSINLRSFQSSSYIGNWCVVPFKSSFARASIVSTETDEFTVYLQDYGNQISLPFSALYEIPDFARVLPAITRVFSLNGIEVLKSTPDLKQYFNDLVLEKKFKMIVQPSPNGRTQSCDLFTERGINVLDQLRTCFGSYPVHTLNTTSFYRVLVTDVKLDQDIPWTFTVRMENDQYNFEQLKQEMTMYCNSLEPNEHYDPSIGTPVFVITDDMVCHRATVIGKSVTGIEVRYVDYGNLCTHLPSQLRPALTSLVNRLPIQGLQCQLQSAADSRQAWGIFKELAFEKSWSMRVLSMVKGTNVLMVRLYDESVNPVRDINIELCLRSVEYPQTMYQPPYQCPSVPPGFRPRVPLPQPTPTSLHGASSHHPQSAGFMYPAQPLHSPTAAQNNAGGVTLYGQSTTKLYRPLSEQLGQQPAPQLAYYPSRHLETPQMPQQVPDGVLSSHQWSPTALEPTEPTPQMAAQQGSNQSFSLDAPLLPAHQPQTSEGPHAKQLTAEKPLVDDETTLKSLQKDRDRRRRRQAERENESKNDESWGFAKKCMSDLKSSRDDDHSSMGRDRRDGDRSNERVGRDRQDGNHTNEGVVRDRHDGDRSNEGVGRDHRYGNHSYERCDRNRSNGQSRGRDRHDSDRSQNRDRNGSRDYTWGQERESGEKTTRNDDPGRNNGRKQPRGDSWGRDRNRSDGRNRDRGGRDRGNVQMASNHQPEESWDCVDIPSQGSDLARRDESSAPPRPFSLDVPLPRPVDKRLRQRADRKTGVKVHPCQPLTHLAPTTVPAGSSPLQSSNKSLVSYTVGTDETDEEQESEDEKEEFEVEAVMDSRYERGRRMYKVRWRGHGPEEDSWCSEDNMNCPVLVQEYLTSLKDTSGESLGSKKGKKRKSAAKDNEEDKDEEEEYEDLQHMIPSASYNFKRASNGLHICPVCQKQCKHRWHMVSHLRVHTGERPFQCQECHKAFCTSTHVQTHIKFVHTNEQGYVCHQCKAKFVQRCDLNRHVNQVHRNLRPYTCKDCDFRASRKVYLQTHIQAVHNTSH